MLRVNPAERVEISDVVAYCEKIIASLNKDKDAAGGEGSWKFSKMDPVLIMDDIIEKLHLLDYQK